ncbi:MAG TPA: hypothetical protein VE078_20595 [Thermoanaerobaculia bacterium]|nr:hypothetical protein [Thermoanaerobaculia bacterium]
MIRGVGRTVVDWHRWPEPPTRVVVGIGGVAAGPPEGPFVPRLFLSPEGAEDAHWLARTYSPFRAGLGRGELVFHGRGHNRPSPVERRMIVEWTRRVAAELASGRSGEPYGLALSWHRGASAETCESVSIFLNGEVWAKACAWGNDPSRGRLQSEALARVFDWFDSLKAFQGTHKPGVAGDAEPSRLVFAGRGKMDPTAAEQDAIEAFAATLFRELSARRRGGAPLPAPANMASVRLLLPPSLPRAAPALARLAPRLPPPLPPRRSLGS